MGLCTKKIVFDLPLHTPSWDKTQNHYKTHSFTIVIRISPKGLIVHCNNILVPTWFELDTVHKTSLLLSVRLFQS